MDCRARLIPALPNFGGIVECRIQVAIELWNKTGYGSVIRYDDREDKRNFPHQDICRCDTDRPTGKTFMACPTIYIRRIRTNLNPVLEEAMMVNACYLPMLEKGYIRDEIHQLALWGDKENAPDSLMDQIYDFPHSVNSRDSAGNTLLMLACAAKPCSFEVIKYLVEKTTEDYVNAENKDGLTALHFATLNNEPDVVDLLLIHKANVNAGSVTMNGKQYGLTPLLISVIAFREGKPNKCLTHLLKWNPDMTVEVVQAAIKSEGLNFRWECECGACVTGPLAYSLRSILPPSKITTRMWHRKGTAVYQLVRNNCSRSHLQALMDHMKRTGVYDSIMEQPTHFHGLTIFGIATRLSHYDLMEAILERDPSVVNHAKADILGVNKIPPLIIHLTSNRGFRKEFICEICQKYKTFKDNVTHKYVDLLLGTSGVEVDIQDALGRTPLMFAARNGHDYACEKLINKGAHPLRLDYRWESALMFALDLELDLRVKIIQILLRTGCGHELAQQPFNDSSLLWKVMEKKDVTVLGLLHRAGAISDDSRVQMMDEVNIPYTYTSEEHTQAVDEFRLALKHMSTPPPLLSLCLLFFSSRKGTGSPGVRASGLRDMITDEETEEDRDLTQTTSDKNETTGLVSDYHGDEKRERKCNDDEKEETDLQRVLWGMFQPCFKDLGIL